MGSTPCSMFLNSIPFERSDCFCRSCNGPSPVCRNNGGPLHTVAIALGSNLEHPLATLQSAWLDIQSRPCLTPVALSSPYRSEPVGMDSANWFVNAAAVFKTSLPPHDLLHLLHTVEHKFGRKRYDTTHGYQDRTLDLDCLLYDDLILCDEHLSIPHPRMTDRLFVLAPLAEIAGECLHPHRRVTVATLLAKLQSRHPQQKIEPIRWLSDFPSYGYGQEKRFMTGQFS